MNFRKLSVSDHVAIAATVIALTSLAVSVRSCQQADHVAAIAERDFEEGRTFFWLGSVDEATHQLQLSPSNPDVRIQSVRVTLPQILGAAWDNVDERALTFSLAAAHTKLKAFLEQSGVYTVNNVFNVMRPTSLPVVIDSRYVVKGRTATDRSLYYLTLDVAALMTPNQSPHYTVQGIKYSQLQFARRVPDDVTAESEVEAAWTRQLAELRPVTRLHR